MRPLEVLDLCAGLGGLSEGFLEAGDHVVRVDIDPRFADVPGTVIADVLEYRDGRELDVIVSGPPCEGFSVAAIRFNYSRDRTPKGKALIGRLIVRAVLAVVEAHPEATWLLENPRGMMRKYLGRPRETVFYCSYGDSRAKPTDLWGNYPAALALPCVPHVAAPRGSRNPGSTQGIGDRAERARVPIALSRRIRETIAASRGRTTGLRRFLA